MGGPLDESEEMTEMEEMLFGVTKPKRKEELYISERDFVPLKTGQPGYKILKEGPKHIMHADAYEPLYVPPADIFEDCLRREAERVAH
mmetsp:Transcript_14003/g.21830  ORF Transcript_14003/g.21830 Transcript_14003/m.21830 type:complete len:88 (+) Transcript_14003:470-733(+)